MTISALCRTCGRTFPLPPSGRSRCLNCELKARTGGPLSRERRRGPCERRAHVDRRARSDRRLPAVILADRRLRPMPAMDGRRMGPTERRLASDRREADRRTLADRRAS